MNKTAKVKITRKQMQDGFANHGQYLLANMAVGLDHEGLTLEIPLDQIEMPLIVRDEVFEEPRSMKDLSWENPKRKRFTVVSLNDIAGRKFSSCYSLKEGDLIELEEVGQ